MTIVIRPTQSTREVRQLEDVQEAAWGMAERIIAPYHVFHAWMHVGGIVLGAFDGPQMVGFAASFLGESQGQRVHWSHMAAVIPAYQGQGIGKGLKFAQREAVLAQGLVHTIAWTYDPLQMRNAALNLNALGATCQTMHFEFYGQMPDEVNRIRLSDRFEVQWALKSERVLGRMASAYAPQAPENIILRVEKDAPALILPNTHDAPEYGVELPANVEKLPDSALIQAWYYALREAAVPLFEAGYTLDRVYIAPNEQTFAYVFKRPEIWYLYVLETKDGSLYTGITNDVDRRLAVHNSGRGAKYTAMRRPVTLLAAWQTFGRAKASQLEYHFKRLSRPQKIAAIAAQGDFRDAARAR